MTTVPDSEKEGSPGKSAKDPELPGPPRRDTALPRPLPLGLTLLVVAILLVAWRLFSAQVLAPHLYDGFRDAQRTSEQLYMISAVIGAAGAILQGGILVLAPLLSLTLHQSYDALFDLIRETIDSDSPQERALAREGLERLRRYKRRYEFLNPVFYGFWVFTCLFMAIAALRLLTHPWFDTNIIHEALSFFIASMLLALSFALIALLFFLAIRPGITKLDFYQRLFTMRIKP